MLSDAAAADRAAFLKREARRPWGVRVAGLVPVAMARLRARLRGAQALRMARVRGADGLDYLVVKGVGDGRA